jgi:hypothetical protein
VGLSIVRDKVNLKPQDVDDKAITKGFKLALTCIVFNIDEDELYNQVELGLGMSLPESEYEEIPDEE